MTAQLTDEKDVAEQSFHEVYVTRASLRGSVISEEKGTEGGAPPVTTANTRSEAERRLLRKLDMRFMPTIVLIYIMNYIDVRDTVLPMPPIWTLTFSQRVAVSAARLKGLSQDLGLSGRMIFIAARLARN